jgi:hypothetical protein
MGGGSVLFTADDDGSTVGHRHGKLPRVAYLSLPPEWVFVVFPMQRDSELICDGLTAGDFRFCIPSGWLDRDAESCFATLARRRMLIL